MMIENENQNEHEDDEISFKVEPNKDAGAPVFEGGDESLSVDAEDDSNPLEDPRHSSEPGHSERSEESLTLAPDGDPSAAPQDDEAASHDDGAASQDDGTLPLVEELTLTGKIEAIIFASPKPLRSVEIHELLMDQGYTLKELQDCLDELTELYRDRGGGFHLRYIKRMGYQFQTTPAAKSLMEKQFSSRPRPLSRAALETLAVIAYRQKINKGVTRAEVEFIRGVDAGSIFKTLMERNLLTCVGRKEIPGRPMMFGVTDEFLKIFQLGSINDLPPLESFQTPTDVIQAANEKIAEFEAQQEGVDPEEFIGDEAYTDALGEGDFDALSAAADPYAPSLERLDEVREDAQLADKDIPPVGSVPAEVLADLAKEAFSDMSEDEFAAETIAAEAVAVPLAVLDTMRDVTEVVDPLDQMAEGEIGFARLEQVEVRTVQGASVAPRDDVWDETEAVSESPETAPAPEVLPDELLAEDALPKEGLKSLES